MNSREVRKCLERCIKAQIEKVDAMNPLDENYEKEVAKLIALQDATDRRKPKIDWLGWFTAVGDVGLGIVTVA